MRPWLMALALLGASSTVLAAKVAGVTLDDSLTVGDTELMYNGAGVRKKLFIKLYVAGLYLEASEANAEAIIDTDAPMAIRLHVLSDLVNRKRMTKSLKDGFHNATGGNTAPIQRGIDALLQAMPSKIRPGERFDLIYEPGAGTRLEQDGETRVTIDGLDFKRALFGIWLSDNPAQGSLKSAMLGR